MRIPRTRAEGQAPDEPHHTFDSFGKVPSCASDAARSGSPALPPCSPWSPSPPWSACPRGRPWCTKNGTSVGSLLPDHFNNRHISWSFVPAPNYSGDISIGFLQGAQAWWPAISVSHLANGIHGVEYLANGTWTTAAMNSDMG